MAVSPKNDKDFHGVLILIPLVIILVIIGNIVRAQSQTKYPDPVYTFVERGLNTITFKIVGDFPI